MAPPQILRASGRGRRRIVATGANFLAAMPARSIDGAEAIAARSGMCQGAPAPPQGNRIGGLALRDAALQAAPQGEAANEDGGFPHPEGERGERLEGWGNPPWFIGNCPAPHRGVMAAKAGSIQMPPTSRRPHGGMAVNVDATEWKPQKAKRPGGIPPGRHVVASPVRSNGTPQPQKTLKPSSVGLASAGGLTPSELKSSPPTANTR